MGRYFVFDFLVKGKHPDVQRWTFYTLKDLDNSFQDEAVLHPEGKSYFDKETLEKYYDSVRWGYESFNRYFISHKLPPPFDPSDLTSCIKKRKWLSRMGEEAEIAALFGVGSFAEYTPEVYENDLTSAIALIFEPSSLYYRILTVGYDKEKSLEMGIAGSDEEATNLHLARYGRPPLFPEDEEASKKRREELFRLRPLAECEAYLDATYPAHSECERKIVRRFGIEKYCEGVYETDGGGTKLVYHIGWMLRYIANRERDLAGLLKYAREINALCGCTVLEEADEEGLASRARELIALYPAERIIQE